MKEICQTCSVQPFSLLGTFKRYLLRAGLVLVCRSVGCSVYGCKPVTLCDVRQRKSVYDHIASPASQDGEVPIQLLTGCSYLHSTVAGVWHSHFWDPRCVKSQLSQLPVLYYFCCKGAGILLGAAVPAVQGRC